MKILSLLLLVFSSITISIGFQIPSKIRCSSVPKKICAVGRPFGKSTKSHVFTRASPHVAATSAATDGEWTKKRLHNTPMFRSGAILAALGLAGFASGSPVTKIPGRAAAILHLLSFATWFGTVFYTTFIFGITAFKNLPRKTFGKLQSKLFPKYFMMGSLMILIQVLHYSLDILLWDWGTREVF